MFESTLEAQALHDGERRLGTLSAAVLAHVVLGVAIVSVTALIVPPVHPPEIPPIVFTVAPPIPIGDVTPHPNRLPPTNKGVDAAQPKRTIVPPRDMPPTPPIATPALPPVDPTDRSLSGPDRPGDGIPGQPDGSDSGVPGGPGGGDAGARGDQGQDPVDLTGDMVRPALLVKVEPSYPQAARRAGLGGRVTLRAVIAEDGNVESVEVVASTNPLFDEAAVDAVRKWRYRPALMNGRAVRVYFSVVVNFLVR
jgi:periplasmic protein TonB